MEKRARDLVPGDVVRFHKGNRTVAEVKEGAVRSKHTNRPYTVMWVRWEGTEGFTWKTGRSEYLSVVVKGSCRECGTEIPEFDWFCGPCGTQQDWGEGI